MAVRISFEFLETGGVKPVADFSPIRLFRYRGARPYPGASVVALELLTLIFLLSYTFVVRRHCTTVWFVFSLWRV